jgi:signal transduction histidine kinase
MNSLRALEPGVLPAFRLFIGVYLAITALGVLLHWLVALLPPSSVQALALLSLLESGVLFVYLSLSVLQRRLAALYLPIGIAWAAAGPLLDPYLNLLLAPPIGHVPPDLHAESALWRQLIVLLIPLVVISWQYGMHQVIGFCGLTAVLNGAMLWHTVPFPELLASGFLRVIGVQLVVFFLVGLMIVRLMHVQRAQRELLSAANDRLAAHAATLEQLTITRERVRLAREVHDVLAHTLSGVAVELEGLRAMLPRDPERANGLLAHALQAVRDGLSETRRAVKELRAQPLEELGLALAVRALAESYASRFDLALELAVDPDLGEVGAEVQQCVYRIAQEALNNIAEHAQARHVRLVLRWEDGQLRLVVRDDGCGFAAPDDMAAAHYGLLGMRERSAMVGGCLTIESQAGQGTQIVFTYRGGA